MKRTKLTPLAKIILFILVIGAFSFGMIQTGAINDIKGLFTKNKPVDSEQAYEDAGKINKEENTMNISLDEWVGWKSVIDANGGLTTQPGSIYDKLGIKVNISVINDATQSSNALIKGDLNGAGYTINRYSFLQPKFESSNVEVVMPYVTNASTGGDGIIAKKEIKSIEDLVGKKVGVPRFSEAQTLVEWLLAKSSLTTEQVNDIRKNMILFDTPDDTAKAFFAGELDAAATWQPYLLQADQLTDGHLLFSTKNATNIILDGIVFRKDYLDANKEIVSKFIEGSLQAKSLYDTDFKAIKNTFPMFATETDENIKSMTGDAMLINATSNVEMLSGGTAVTLFSDMSDIWTAVGEKSNKAAATNAFDNTLVKELVSKFPGETVNTVKFTEEEKEEAKAQDNNDALLTQTLTINFEPDSVAISSDSFAQLAEFAKTAKILDGVIIQVEGNTAATGESESVLKKFSEDRANSVARFLQTQGLDPSRFVIVGNGASKVNSNKPEENRRTDIYFKVVGR